MMIHRLVDIVVRKPVHVTLQMTIVIEVRVGNEICGITHLGHCRPKHNLMSWIVLYFIRN